jgi:hypothetical protein
MRLLAMRAAGKSVISIGLALRRSTTAIEGRIGVLRAKERQQPTAQDQGSVQTEQRGKGRPGAKLGAHRGA